MYSLTGDPQTAGGAREGGGWRPERRRRGWRLHRTSGIRRGAIDELMLDVVPFLLGAGERLFGGVKDRGLQPVEVIHSSHATHIRYRIGR